MQTLSTELRGVISKRIERAGSNELMAIAMAVCSQEENPIVLKEVADDLCRARVAEASDFEILDDEIVVDRSTDLMWTRQNVISERQSHKDATAACEALATGGYRDWRLPTIRELLSLVDYEKCAPCIDTDFFGCESSWYWTSTPAAASPADDAWSVSFSYGSAGWFDRDSRGFVRAVRPSQS